MLVPRIADVEQGAVRIDGHDVRELTLGSLGAAVGFVMQDPHLFHDTIRANLRYAKPDATDAELVEACRAARIHDLVTSLPDGYDTIVGERGYRMSGGEKQRLAIARVLLKQPAIVILDEATSHLDSESEHAIQRALDAALEGRTAIVIAHRLSTDRATPTASSCSTTARSWSRARTRSCCARGRPLRRPVPHAARPRRAAADAGPVRCPPAADAPVVAAPTAETGIAARYHREPVPLPRR